MNSEPGDAGALPPHPMVRRERRTNRLLRLLIDEMLDQVRELQRHAGPWPPDERAAAEEALARIMGQVRQAAVTREPPTEGSR
ncbi:MAG: hypothetical protein MNPFHGCM_01245 [Gemmatimonadaceae bacterium]|nr:hypothetical protein [Gemmatimonadaceae bacterium]